MLTLLRCGAVRSKDHCCVHLCPYSEHSSYSELQDYVRFLKPHKVLHENARVCVCLPSELLAVL